MKTTHIALTSRSLPLLVSCLAAILLAAGCAEIPERACPPCAGCAQCPAVQPPAARARYEAVPFAALPGWHGASLAAGLQAFVAGCPHIPAASPLASACEAARRVAGGDEATVRRFVEERFIAYAIESPEGLADGLVTGYYEPVIAGARTRGERFRLPVYGVPDDLVVVDLAALHPELGALRLRGRLDGRRLVPYWSRTDIEGGGVPLPARALAWVEDAVELFFLQIQGSGQVELPGGERIRLGYADQNGHPYRSLGRHLVERGELRLEQASMQGIKAWAAANPAKLGEMLNVNASYVFFRELPADGGPIGALGAPLTAGHSLAVDARFVPLGAPVFLATTWPLSAEPLQRLMAAQDTGGAIRGATRADFFWGPGAEAGALAGRMRQPGRLWILWPREAPPPRPSRTISP